MGSYMRHGDQAGDTQQANDAHELMRGLLHIEKRGMGGRARRGTKQRGAAENTRKAIVGAFESVFSSAILRRFLDQNPDS